MEKNEIIASQMLDYTGVKYVRAIPMTKREYASLRGWKECVTDMIQADSGYLVEYKDTRSNIEGFKGYVTWLTKENFEKIYRISETPLHRMRLELVDLQDKIKKAVDALEELPLESTNKSAMLLMTQLDFMRDYAHFLKLRIDLEESKYEKEELESKEELNLTEIPENNKEWHVRTDYIQELIHHIELWLRDHNLCEFTAKDIASELTHGEAYKLIMPFLEKGYYAYRDYIGYDFPKIKSFRITKHKEPSNQIYEITKEFLTTNTEL